MIPCGDDGILGTAVQIADPPVDCKHIGGGSSGGILIDDPKGLGGPYILAKGTGTASVWKYINGVWSPRGYTHPYRTGSTGNGTNWCIAACYPVGGFLYIPDPMEGPRLWKPND